MLLHARVLTDGKVKKTYRKRNERHFKTIKKDARQGYESGLDPNKVF